MNLIIEILLKRKSIRAYEDRSISTEEREAILQATLRSPTAGNMMLYSIIEVTEQSVKDTLVKTCDNQPFIAKAPLVWLFLADYQRWMDTFILSGVEQNCTQKGTTLRKPEEGDLFLACSDALIAAQTSVLAAESLGIGSCYIGDIMENYEIHKDLFKLPQYTFPICMVCYGYPTRNQMERKQTSRFDKKYILFENHYERLVEKDFVEIYADKNGGIEEAQNIGQSLYTRKFNADFTIELNRSVRVILNRWRRDLNSNEF